MITGFMPADFFILQSEEYLDRLLEGFQKMADLGYDPDMVKEKVFAEVGCSENDLTDYDKDTLVKRVRAMYL